MGKDLDYKYLLLFVTLLLVGAFLLSYMAIRAYNADKYLASDEYKDKNPENLILSE